MILFAPKVPPAELRKQINDLDREIKEAGWRQSSITSTADLLAAPRPVEGFDPNSTPGAMTKAGVDFLIERMSRGRQD